MVHVRVSFLLVALLLMILCNAYDSSMDVLDLQDLRELENDDLNLQLDVFEDHKDDDFLEFQHRWRDITINFEYPFS